MTSSDMGLRGSGTGRTISRRTVVRTGAHAAWAVPAISIATAAPALAVSHPPKLVGNGVVSIFYGGRWRMVITVRPIANDGDTGVGPITIVIYVPRKRGALGRRPDKRSHSGAGWRYAGAARSGSRWRYTFTYPQGLAANAKTSTLSVTLKPRRRRPVPSGTVSYMASAAGASSDTRSTKIGRR